MWRGHHMVAQPQFQSGQDDDQRDPDERETDPPLPAARVDPDAASLGPGRRVARFPGTVLRSTPSCRRRCGEGSDLPEVRGGPSEHERQSLQLGDQPHGRRLDRRRRQGPIPDPSGQDHQYLPLLHLGGQGAVRAGRGLPREWQGRGRAREALARRRARIVQRAPHREAQGGVHPSARRRRRLREVSATPREGRVRAGRQTRPRNGTPTPERHRSSHSRT